jgi:hypothetical protein
VIDETAKNMCIKKPQAKATVSTLFVKERQEECNKIVEKAKHTVENKQVAAIRTTQIFKRAYSGKNIHTQLKTSPYHLIRVIQKYQ